MIRGEKQEHGLRLPVAEVLEPRILLDLARAMPWVAGVTENSVWVCAEITGNTPDATVYYGETASYGLTAATASTQATDYGYYVHNVQLTGLLPNTQYHYKITHGSSESAGYTFYTAPSAGTGARWGFAADCRSDPAWHNTMAGLIDAQGPRMMVYGGDLCYAEYWSYWDQEWFMYPYYPSYTNQVDLNVTTPFVNAVGNHEKWFNNGLTKAFTHEPNGDGVNGDGYFSFDYGDAHILVLNTSNKDKLPYNEGSAQWNFAAADLAASTKPWKIVATHVPAYCAGGHWNDADLQDLSTDVLAPNGVDLFLAGHSHFYQHNYADGIHHMVIGTFGVATAEPYYDPSWYTLYSEETRCFGIFDTTPTTLTLTTYRQNGTVIETINLTHDATPPTTPTGLAAAAVSDTEMWLTWNESSDPETGVDHYNVYRDSVLVGTTTQTCYSDTGLDELTSYTYEVSAVNGDGVEGAKGTPVAQSTLADTTPPEIFTVWSAWPTEVEVMFSEPVEEATAEVAGNYTIDLGVSVSSATLLADTKTVKLIVSTLSESTTYTLTVNNVRDRAATPNAIAADSQATFEYVPWQNQDVGSPSPAGSMSYSAGQYTIESNGHDIFDASDDFHFVYRTLDSDGEIIARAVNDTNLWAAKSGVMMRDSLAGSSTEVCMVFGHQVTSAWYQTRFTTGAGTSYASASGITAPEYTKVVRLNGEFTGYISEDGLAWTQVGGATAPGDMTSGSVYFGLAACSHATGTLGTFYLDNVKVIEYGPNTAPAGSADTYCVNQDAHLNVAPSRGVLDNDTDADGDAISAALVSGAAHGTVDLYANGSFGYTPDDGYTGPDSFTYKAGDGRGESSEVTVTINVAAIGNIPGDANRDDTVDGQDFTILKAYFGESVSPPAGSAAASESSAAGGDGSDSLSDFAAAAFAARPSALPAHARPAADTLPPRRLGPPGLSRLVIPAPAGESGGLPAGGLPASRPISSALAAGADEDAVTLEVELDTGLVDVLAEPLPAAHRL